MTTQRKGKKAITLLEVLIVMMLLGTAFSACMFPIIKAVRGERFERGVDQIISRLELAQEMMLDFKTDVRVILNQVDEGTITCSLITEKVLPPFLEKALNRYEKISGITQIAFEGKTSHLIELEYEGVLGATPCGTLSFSFGSKEQTLFLKGYPAQIKRGEHAQYRIMEAAYPLNP